VVVAFAEIVTHGWDCQCSHLLHSIVSLLLLDVTVFLKLMNVSEATRQLLRRLAFNLHNFGLYEIELKLVGKDRAEQPNETIQRKYKTGELDNFEKLLVLSY